MVYLKGRWGVQPQVEFNVVQKSNDKVLLEAINEFFDNKGNIFTNSDNICVLTFRSVPVLKNVIIPYFLKYPLISRVPVGAGGPPLGPEDPEGLCPSGTPEILRI